MADNFTDTAESLMLNWIFGVGTPTRPTTPLKVALVTAAGSDSAAGTEVTGGSYARQSVTMTSSSAGSASTNTADVVFTGMPAATVVGVEIWDSNGTPVRLAYGNLSSSKTTTAGDSFTISAGNLSMTIA